MCKSIVDLLTPGEVAAFSESELILDPANPVPTARLFIEHRHHVSGKRSLQHQAGVFYGYQPGANAYVEVEGGTLRSQLYAFLEPAMRWSEPKGDQPPALVPFKPTKAKVENVLDALRALCNLSSSQATPSWLESSVFDPVEILACKNGLLHVPTRKLLKPTPQFFTLNGIDFEFNAAAPVPVRWLQFLRELWEDDDESIQALQEWIGYLLTPSTHFQKMLMIVGPKRSGKGTIARVIRMLLGDGNVCGPTLANMAQPFGLAILIGKSAAIIADARISGRSDTAVIAERLLSISGEDALSIPRKYLPDWNGKLLTRFTLMTNELPRIEDSSGALASRFQMLILTKSFYGREDHRLLDQFIPELPGILRWALEGWDRLYGRGRFQQPASTLELIQQFEDLASPVGAFVRESCDINPAYEIRQDRLFEVWKQWCGENGRERPGTIQQLGKDLRAAVPWLRVTQPRIQGVQVRYWTGVQLKDDTR